MKVKIQWTYRPNRSKTSINFTSDLISINEALLAVKDIEKTGRAKQVTFYDETGMEWLQKELEKYIKQIDTEPHNVTAFFDGGFAREESLAGLGVVIYYEQNGNSYRIRKNDSFEQIDNNNEAEYAAFWLMLLELERIGVTHQDITIKGDSQVVLNHLSGDWPCYEEDLNRWLDRIEKKLNELGLRPSYELIIRTDNKEADQLATQALKGIPISSTIQLNEV